MRCMYVISIKIIIMDLSLAVIAAHFIYSDNDLSVDFSIRMPYVLCTISIAEMMVIIHMLHKLIRSLSFEKNVN